MEPCTIEPIFSDDEGPDPWQSFALPLEPLPAALGKLLECP